MEDPLIGMTFSFVPSAPSRERDDAPRGGNGSQVLPVAQLDQDFDGQPEDGMEYLFLVRREASQRAKITRAPNPYEVVQAEEARTNASPGSAVSRPDEAWRDSFVRNFASARQRMQRAPLHALEPIDPADIPPPRDGSTWRVFVSGKRAKSVRSTEAAVSHAGQAPTATSAQSDTPMSVDATPVDELAAMKAAVLASLELDEDAGKVQASPARPAPDTNSNPELSSRAQVSAPEPEYDRLPRLPSPGLISAIPGPSIIHVLSHFDEWLTERFETYEDKVSYVPSTIFAPPSLRRRAGAAVKSSTSRPAAPLPIASTASTRPAVGRAPLPTAHESHWMLSLLTRLEQVLDGDDLATLRQLAKTLVRLAETSAKSQTGDGNGKPGTGRSMESRREDEEEAEGRARCWMIVAAISSIWSQADLWDPSL
ncbi:hypothetical protein JCM10908_000153 [Rhodotorula pacifica]|uniref:uncharacterized protein n=1 Tax=Rhodotorula pacifica TaxID=1495444 RepID=UPI0031763866